MDIQKLAKIGAAVLIVIVAVLVVVGEIERRKYKAEIARLRNTIAERDKTIETAKDVYEILTRSTKDIYDALLEKGEEVRRLKEEIKSGKEEILTANTLVVKWKKAYEASVKGTQTVVYVDGEPKRTRVDFEKDFGYIGVSGYTVTDPPEATVKIQQNRPLRLTAVVSQDKEGAWHTRVASSEENVAVDLQLAAVNPWLLTPKWYEKIGVDVDLGVGTGFLGGIGASYELGNFDVGPKAWLSVTDRVDRYFGVGLTWHPFRR